MTTVAAAGAAGAAAAAAAGHGIDVRDRGLGAVSAPWRMGHGAMQKHSAASEVRESLALCHLKACCEAQSEMQHATTQRTPQ